MLFDEIAALFNQESHRAMARRTGLGRGKVESLQHGCSFVLDTRFLAALDLLGYELRLCRRGGVRGGHSPRRLSGFPGKGRGRVKSGRGGNAACQGTESAGRQTAAAGSTGETGSSPAGGAGTTGR